MNKQKNTVQKYEYKAEMKQLLNIIVHSLYTHPEVFLRELISNSSDALNKMRFRKLTDSNIIDPDADLKIMIELDSKNQIFSIEDTGIGMSREELIDNIGTVARSGTIEFLNKIKQDKKSFNDNLIGQFGVGFYSVFMVADEVTIETRHGDVGSKAYRWRSRGDSTFTTEEIDKKSRGTRISFKLKDSAKDFCQDQKVKDTIKKYSNFADFPVFLKDEVVNKVTALWHKKADDIKQDELDEFYKFITNDFNEPLGHLHMSIEGAVNFKALIFIPKTAPFDLLRSYADKSLHLYSNKILIQNDCRELLPEYLRFLNGVVDTADLPLNVSREVTQSSPAMAKIKDVLTSKILSFLQDWADNDQDKYEHFYRNFSAPLKTGINIDYKNRDKIIELLRFETSLTEKGKLTSLKDYVARMKKGQKEIYYLSGEHRMALESNPNLEYFKKKEIEVLLLTDPVDIFTVPSINEYEKKPVKSIDKADIDLMPEDKIEKPDDNLSKSIIALFKETLGDKVEDVAPSARLITSAVTLVTPGGAVDSQMEKMLKIMNKDYSASKKIMEVNISHPLMRNLSRIYISDSTNPVLRRCILQLYEGALLIDGNLNLTVDFVKRMTQIMEDATK